MKTVAAQAASGDGSGGIVEGRGVYGYKRVKYGSRREWLRPVDLEIKEGRKEERRELRETRARASVLNDFGFDPGLGVLDAEIAQRKRNDLIARETQIEKVRKERAEGLRRARAWEKSVAADVLRDDEEVILAFLEVV